jgi:hypothetical protein
MPMKWSLPGQVKSMNFYHKVSDVLTNCIKHDLLLAPCDWRGTRSPQYLTLKVVSLYIGELARLCNSDSWLLMFYGLLETKECYVFSGTGVWQMLRWCSAKQLGGCREVILISLEARAKTDMVARGTFRFGNLG